MNINGLSNLLTATESSLYLKSGRTKDLRTYSVFIFKVFDCSFWISNLDFYKFFPRLIYASFSLMNVSNCFFGSSYEKFGSFDVCAIYLEYNISFSISTSKFDSLQNDDIGAVS